MSYCRKCGAYIPDSMTKCLACGFDEAAQAAYAKAAEEKERLDREKVEQHRREQQDLNRKWAEAEKNRRERTREFTGRAAEVEEKVREKAEQFAHAASESETVNRIKSTASESLREGRLPAILSYVYFLCFLSDVFGIKDEFTRYHARQGRKLFFWGLIASVVGLPFGIGEIMPFVQVILMIIGIKNAANGRKEPLPIIGNLNIF